MSEGYIYTDEKSPQVEFQVPYHLTVDLDHNFHLDLRRFAQEFLGRTDPRISRGFLSSQYIGL